MKILIAFCPVELITCTSVPVGGKMMTTASRSTRQPGTRIALLLSLLFLHLASSAPTPQVTGRQNGHKFIAANSPRPFINKHRRVTCVLLF